MESAGRHGRVGGDARNGHRPRDARGNEPGHRGRSRDRSVRPHHVRRNATRAVSLRARRLSLLARQRRTSRELGRGRGGMGRAGGPGAVLAHGKGHCGHPARPAAGTRCAPPGALTVESPLSMPDTLSRDDAWALLTEWTQSESLRKHALAVEAAVRGYARQFGEDEDAWGVVALLHDFDYERYPTPENHPFRGCDELQRRGYPEWVTRAILSHAE